MTVREKIYRPAGSGLLLNLLNHPPWSRAEQSSPMQGPATFSYFIFNTPAPTPKIRSIRDCVAVIPGLDTPPPPHPPASPPSMFKMLMSAAGWSITHLANRARDRFRKRQMYQHPSRQICLPFNGRLAKAAATNRYVCAESCAVRENKYGPRHS